MRIAFFVEGMSASGVDTSTQLLATALRRAGHSVVFFHPWREREGKESKNIALQEPNVLLPGLRVSHRQPVYLSVPVSLAMLERFRSGSFDIIHVHTSTTINLLAWQARTLMDLPVIYTYHTMSVEYAHYLGPLAEPLSGVVRPSIEFYDRMICNGADALVAPSAKARRYLESIGVRPPIHLIPNGIDLGRFRPERSDFLRERLGIAPERPILLWVGRLNQEKRPLLAYSLFRRIHAARPDAALVMVGVGALRDDLLAEVEADGLADSVFLYGLAEYADMPSIYGSADLWISTSLSEVHPMVAIEAAACGLPAVTWNDSALDGVVEPGLTGDIVDNANDFVAAAVRQVEDAERRRTMGNAAAAMAGAFAVETTAERMAELYDHVVAHHGRPRDLSSLSTFLAARKARERRGPTGRRAA